MTRVEQMTIKLEKKQMQKIRKDIRSYFQNNIGINIIKNSNKEATENALTAHWRICQYGCSLEIKLHSTGLREDAL